MAGAVLIAAAAVFCVASTYRVFSKTVDEPIHIAAGFEWLDLPIYPFLSICAAYAVVANWRGMRRALVALLLVLYFGSTVVAYPDYLAWFNAAAGPHPEQIALDSNLDWGQDLLRLTEVVREEKIDRLHLAYFGSADLQRHSLPAHHLEQGKCVTGWVAISEHFLQFDGYKWLKSFKPARRVGKSIRLYSIPSCFVGRVFEIRTRRDRHRIANPFIHNTCVLAPV